MAPSRFPECLASDFTRNGGWFRADATVSGPPAPMLRWIWNEEDSDQGSAVSADGSGEAVDELKRRIVIATP